MSAAPESVASGASRSDAESPPPDGGALKAPPPNTLSPATRSRQTRQTLVPPAIAEKFLKVGEQYFFADRSKAFTDQGSRLIAQSENTVVIRALVGIAEARGWSTLKITGSQRFRREVAREAQALGLTIKGRAPIIAEPSATTPPTAPAQPAASASDPVTVADAANTATDRDARPPGAAPLRDRVIYGRLIEAGPARYQHDPARTMSYFVRLETDKGSRTFWGVQLQDALNVSTTRVAIGDEVGLRRLSQERVTLHTPVADPQGHGAAQDAREVLRNRWQIEQREYFEQLRDQTLALEPRANTATNGSESAVPEPQRHERAQRYREGRVTEDPRLRNRPELAAAVAIEKVASLFAQQHLRNVADREQFVSLVREQVATSLERGERIAAPRVRQSPNRDASDDGPPGPQR